MLETIDFKKPTLPKDGYKHERDALMERLVLLQQETKRKGVGLVVLFAAWPGASKGNRLGDMLYLLDARLTKVVSLPRAPRDDIELFARLDNQTKGYYPFMQQFWEGLGERGTTTFYDRGWYELAENYLLVTAREHLERKMKHLVEKASIPVRELVEHVLDPQDSLDGACEVDSYLASIESWERSLTENGYQVVKFFIHTRKKTQRKTLSDLYADPDTRWRVNDEDILRCVAYDEFYELHDALLEKSNFDFAPWHVLNGEDKRRANIEVAQTIVEAMERGIAEADMAHEDKPTTATLSKKSRFEICDHIPRLDKVDRNLALDEQTYKKELKKEQKRLYNLELEMYQQRVPLMVMYEGWDAAGKGGAIKRVAQALDARAYTIFPSPAPTPAELAHPHLWRYWTRLPKAGHVGIYDRSWYGRVLVERVEGFAKPEEWARAYDEINEFERDLVDWGALIIKFWVEVSPDEQLRRFESRQNDPAKQWKITDEDWRNREKRPQYHEAVQDMFRLTSTKVAPWIILESESKYYARVKSLRVINDALEKRLR